MQSIFVPMTPCHEVLEEMPRGGQAAVYKAIHTATKTNVAIKVLLPTKICFENMLLCHFAVSLGAYIMAKSAAMLALKLRKGKLIKERKQKEKDKNSGYRRQDCQRVRELTDWRIGLCHLSTLVRASANSG